MTSLIFTLDPDAIVRFHDIFICLAKFSDTVALEAEPDIVSPLMLTFHPKITDSDS